VSDGKRYTDLFENAPAAYLTTSASGLIQEVNAMAAELLGITPEEAAGKPIARFVADPGSLQDQLSRLPGPDGDGGVEDWEAEIVRRDGDPVPVRIFVRAVAGSEVGPAEVRWLIQKTRPERAPRPRARDLSGEQAARVAMQRVAERARYLAEVSGRLMGVLDPEAVWRTAASALTRLARAGALVELGDDPAEGGKPARIRAGVGTLGSGPDLETLLNRHLDHQTEQMLGVSLSDIANALRHGEPEVRPGTPQTGPCLVIPLRTRGATHGAMVLWLRAGANVGEELLVSRHLADRIALALETARLYQEVVHARRQAEEAGAAEADFLSMVSHELRTPLTAIISYAELLEERVDEMPDQLRRYARQIAAAAQHQRELVEQILSYKALQRSGQGGAPEALDYRDVAQFAIGLVRPQVEDKPVELLMDLPDAPVRGSCDPGMLRQVLANLLTNAIRYTDAGHVRLSLATRDRWVELRVQDTGTGIPPADLPRIYDRFWRGATVGAAVAGSGLGLTITRDLVKHMDGEIEVDSTVGVGTTFTVRIPRDAGPSL
jgi:PAS domain S-box-containing protein